MLSFENRLEFKLQGGSFKPSLAVGFTNFSDFEDGFVWQTARWGQVTFDFESPATGGRRLCDLIVDIDVFKIEEGLPGQDVFFYLNGVRIGSFFVTLRRMVIMPFREGLLMTNDNVLTIDTPQASLPRDYGLDDGRRLGAKLFTFQIRRAD